MKTQKTRNAVLALVGLLALTAYILACTSFSPDDKRLLYPAFDGASGRLGISMYDRASGGSEMVFLPMDLTEQTNGANVVKPPALRPQWLADGYRGLIAWDRSDDLALVVAPVGGRGIFKVFSAVPSLNHDPSELMMMPLPVVGDRVFLRTARNEILRLDLTTGATLRHTFAESNCDLSLWPGPNGKTIFYVNERDGHVFGRMNTETFDRTPLLNFTNQLAEGSFFAYDQAGERVAFVEQGDAGLQLIVLEKRGMVFSRSLEPGTGQQLSWGNAVFSRKGDRLLASYQLFNLARTNSAFGLMEIPLSDSPVRQTPLLQGINVSERMMAFYFQIGFSHDEKTAAVASTYLACAAKDFKPADCALFFIDLKDSKRKITKVPLSLPANRPYF